MTDLGNRIVVLIDMDCFFCQVEAKLAPELNGKPMAVVQYSSFGPSSIIAVNYEARDFGVTRHMKGAEAKEKCPDIQLVTVPPLRNKPDTGRYRTAGREVIEVLKKHCSMIERASVDEAYLDITDLVDKKISEMTMSQPEDLVKRLSNTFVVGYCDYDSNDEAKRTEGMKRWIAEAYGDLGDIQSRRLAIGGLIVEEMRAAIWSECEYRCSAGISYNKILAKLACGLHKPNRQTILPTSAVPALYSSLPVKKVRNLGGKFGNIVMESLSCNVMADLLRFSLADLQRRFDDKTGVWLYNIARGIDNEPVTPRLVCKSIGASKNFPGKQAIVTLDKLAYWVNELAVEIVDRLERDMEENERRTTSLTVSCNYYQDRKIISQSRVCTLNSVKVDKINSLGVDTVIRLLGSVGKKPIAYISISAGKFIPIKGSTNFENYFKAGPSTKASCEANEKAAKGDDGLDGGVDEKNINWRSKRVDKMNQSLNTFDDKKAVEKMNQSLNKFVDKKTTEKINRSVDKKSTGKMNQSVDKKVAENMNESLNKVVDKKAADKMNQSLNKFVDKKTTEKMNQSVDKKSTEKMKESLNESVDKKDEKIHVFLNKSAREKDEKINGSLNKLKDKEDRKMSELFNKSVDKPAEKINLLNKSADQNDEGLNVKLNELIGESSKDEENDSKIRKTNEDETKTPEKNFNANQQSSPLNESLDGDSVIKNSFFLNFLKKSINSKLIIDQNAKVIEEEPAENNENAADQSPSYQSPDVFEDVDTIEENSVGNVTEETREFRNRESKEEAETTQSALDQLKEIFPDLDNIDRSVMQLLPIELQREANKYLKTKKNKEVKADRERQISPPHHHTKYIGKTTFPKIQTKPKAEKKKNSIFNFVVKNSRGNDNSDKKVCPECSQMIKIDKFAEHSDFHVAQNLQRAINQSLNDQVRNSNSGFGSPSVKRKVNNVENLKAAKKPRSIESFFT